VNRRQLARKDLLDDPAATAGQHVEQQEHFATHLDKILGRLRATQKRASAARARHATLTTAAAGLAWHEVRDAVGTTRRIAATAAGLTAQETRADSERKDRTVRQTRAAAELARHAEDGLTPGMLASAATILDGLPPG
jgi:hypothetical protein